MIVADIVPVSARTEVVYRQARHALTTGWFEPGQLLDVAALTRPRERKGL